GPEFADRPPSQIVPTLADQGRYIASEASFYRVLRAHDQLAHRGKTFEDLEHAHTWVAGFVDWYNEHHRHSALKFVTPGQRHREEDQRILIDRARL
ncbi:Integrase catalytic region, partial [Thiorhodococcus drewsii AZ1]